MNEVVNIIIPTYNNPDYLIPALNSMIYAKHAEDFAKIIVVDNGSSPVDSFLPKHLLNKITLVKTGKNLGWEGGLLEGLKHVNPDVEFVMFANDDIHIPDASFLWLSDMVEQMRNPEVGIVGPSSNVVMGSQNIFSPTPTPIFYTNFLIGFCMLVRKSALIKAGGIDDTLPGGDDLDLSIRMRDCGYKLVADKRVFVYHHGFKTGTRVKGNQDQANGWNSFEMWQKTNTAIIKKHGFRKWQECLFGMPPQEHIYSYPTKDTERDVILQFMDGAKPPTYELGCGATKTTSDAIGVDWIAKGKPIATLNNAISVADIVADVSKPLPFSDAGVIIARHILEHLIDPIDTLVNWRSALKKGGRLIISVPDESLFRSIPVNREHKHAFTKEFLSKLLTVTRYGNIQAADGGNGVSFVITGEAL